MKIAINLFCYIVCFTILCAWTLKQTSNIEKAKWIIGTWENKTSKGTVYETWVKIGNKEYSGKSYLIKEKDTVIFENIRIVQSNDGLFYIPTVKNQNEGIPVSFAIKTISETQMIFENQRHDFPQVIAYTKISADSFVAEISGMKNGQQRKQTFLMNRLK